MKNKESRNYSVLSDLYRDGLDTNETEKKSKSKGGYSRKLLHNPEIYFVWFIGVSILDKYDFLPDSLSKDWKLKDYPLPEDWSLRNDVLDICREFLDKEGYRLFGEKIGKKPSVIIAKEFLKFEPTEEILIKVPLDYSKTFTEKKNEIIKLLRRVHKFTSKEHIGNYPELEGADWNIKKTKNTAKYKTTLKKPRGSYYWLVTSFLKYYLEKGKDPKDLDRELKGLRFFDVYFRSEDYLNIEDEYWSVGDIDDRFIHRFRKDTISLYKSLVRGRFPK